MDCLPICWPRAPSVYVRPRPRAPQRSGLQRRDRQQCQARQEEQRLEQQHENLRRAVDAVASFTRLEGHQYPIDLCSKALTDDGLAQILASVQVPRSVTALQLGNNKLTWRAAAELATFLRTQSSVTELDLRGNNLGDRGLEALVGALMGDTTVQRVDLRRVGISNQGAQLFGALLENNRAITSLDLRNNRITSRGVESIVDALERSGSAVDVNLAYLGDKAGQARLAAVLERNNRLLSRRVLSLTWEPPVGESLQIRCHSMDGSEVASELVRVSDTLQSLKELLARRLDLHPRSIALVLPDARLLQEESPGATVGQLLGV